MATPTALSQPVSLRVLAEQAALEDRDDVSLQSKEQACLPSGLTDTMSSFGTKCVQVCLPPIIKDLSCLGSGFLCVMQTPWACSVSPGCSTSPPWDLVGTGNWLEWDTRTARAVSNNVPRV